MLNRGDGSDHTSDESGRYQQLEQLDILRFGEGIALNDLQLQRDQYHLNLIITVLDNSNEAGDKITIERGTIADGGHIEITELFNDLTFDPLQLIARSMSALLILLS